MKRESIVRIVLACASFVLVLIGTLAYASAQQSALNEREARRLIAQVAGSELPESAVRVTSISALGSAATVEAEVTTTFRFARGEGGRWRVAEIRTGPNRWEDVELLTAALNEQKRARAQAELETMAAALQAFRRERGFYVVADSHAVLIDHLAPRYLPRIIRIDPWHRPYEYTGARDRFQLRSAGADGRAGTPDDVIIQG